MIDLLGRGYIKLYSRDPTTANAGYGRNAITQRRGGVILDHRRKKGIN